MGGPWKGTPCILLLASNRKSLILNNEIFLSCSNPVNMQVQNQI